MKAMFFLWPMMCLAAVFSTPAALAAGRQVVHEHLPLGARDRPLERLSGTRHLEFSIGLPLRDTGSLSNLLTELYDPSSPAYRQYLSPDEFAKRFGPTRKDYRAVIAWAKAEGFVVRGTHPNRTLLDLEGPVSSVEKAFNVRMRSYQHAREARSFYAPEGELSLDLPVKVLAVSGLNDFVLPRPMNLKRSWFDAIPYSVPYGSGSGPNGAFIGRDFRNAYAPGVDLDGAGQAVGLFELDGYYLSDIIAYRNLAGLPSVPITNVLVNGFNGHPGFNNIEAALDIAMVMAMAPGLSRVIVYEGAPINANSVLNRMATDNLARQLSSSWGFGPQIDPIRQQIFQQYAAQGQSFFQAAGDDGAWSGPVFPPSDDPYVTVVGGTALETAGPGGSWVSETVWFGSGGGISTSYNLPGWQNGVSTSANQGSATRRNIPDVAALADGVIWLVANNGQQARVGGTSAAAPLWAGFAALINQQAAAGGKPPVGFLNPALYALGSGPDYTAALHDITVGNNTNQASPTKFFATPGYDLCTGWGSPSGSNLINALLTSPDALRISPSGGGFVTGPVGGPFAPFLLSYFLTNSGAKSLNWALGPIPAWLSAWSAGGTLAPASPGATLLLNLTPSAEALPAGLYTATLWVTNLNNNYVHTRTITLSVVTPPTITSHPSNQAVFEGATAVFTVGTAPNAFLSFQWQYDNGRYLTNLVDSSDITGSSTPTLTIRNASPADVGAYSVLVSNAAGVVSSSNAFLTIVPWRPVILSFPGDQAALPGSSVELDVTAVGTQPLSFRWFKNNNPLTDGGTVQGSTSSTLRLTGVSSDDAGDYSVVVSNALGSVTSPVAGMTVLSVSAPGTEIGVLHSFAGGTNGAHPNGLVLATNGTLYGTTQTGGTDASGTLFRLTPGGTPATLYSFVRGTDGANPRAALVRATNGMLYGTTFVAGSNGFGTVFRVGNEGQVSAIFGFDKPEGILPYAPATPRPDGMLYGTTYEGGSSLFFGTVYKLAPDGAAATLHSFTGDTDGGLPYGGLVEGGDGFLYGTTYRGGGNDLGTVFKVTTNGALTTLLSFNRTNGAFPYAGLARSSDGNFYGVTSSGGISTNGSIFRITSEGVSTNLHSFTGSEDGSVPAATLLEASDGNFYGTTSAGGTYGRGTVFRMSPGGEFLTLVQFHGLNGANPIAPLTEGADGQLYGAAQSGGANDLGTLFRFASTTAPRIIDQPANRLAYAGETVRLWVAVAGSPPLHYQWSKNGTNLVDEGSLSGATSRVLTLTNVSPADTGFFAVTVSNALGWVKSTDAFLQVTSSAPVIVQQPASQTVPPGSTVTFKVKADGDRPLFYGWRKNGTNLNPGGNLSGVNSTALTIATVTEADNGNYSVTVSNALGSKTSDDAGLLVIPITAPGTRLKTLRSFAGGSDGSKPNALTRGLDGNLYGTTQLGGAHLSGLLFRAGTNESVTILVEFNSTSGLHPQGALVAVPDGSLLGTARYGGLYGAGTVFRFETNGSLANLYSFTGSTDGSEPLTGLTLGADGDFYGSTTSGDEYGYGNIFRITSGGAFTRLYTFTNGVDGSAPTGALLQAQDGSFYGMTPGGGDMTFGNVFRMTSAGTYRNVYSFGGGTDGYQPAGALVQGADGNLYGVTKFNTILGYTFYGTIFKVSTNGALSTLYAFNYGNGTYPAAGLVEGADGNFYGTTYQGGAYDLGVVFRMTPAGSYATLVNCDGFNSGAHPASAPVFGGDDALYGTTTDGGPAGSGTVFKLSFAPRVISSPTNREVFAGQNVTFSVDLFGTKPLAYRWRHDGVPLMDGPNIFGSASSTLSLSSVTAANAGSYSLVVTNSLGAVTNAGPTLVVLSPPVFQDVRRVYGAVQLTWIAVAGHSYQLQFKPGLDVGTWTNLGASVTATNSSITALDPLGANAQRYYRVQVVK